jgi:hypothetical protein
MPMPSNQFGAVPNALHRVRQPQDGRRHPEVFEPHELIMPGAAAIPRLAPEMFQALAIELDIGAEIGAADKADRWVKLLRFSQDLVKFFIREFQPGHFKSG